MPRLSTVVLVTENKTMDTNWNIGDSLWTSGNNFLLSETLAQIAWKGCAVSSLEEENPKAVWDGPESLALDVPTLAEGLDRVTSTGRFQCQPLCESVISIQIISWFNPSHQLRSCHSFTPIGGMGTRTGREKVRKHMDWDSLINKVKSVHTSKIQQGIHRHGAVWSGISLVLSVLAVHLLPH